MNELQEINWEELAQEVVADLQALLRLDTTNLPGNEIIAARFLAERLAEAGIEAQVLESAPTRANLVARLRGTGEEEPLLLMSHTDVVPAEPEKWEHPPFSGEIHDGYIWGRGALDMKHIVAQHLTLMRLFAKLAEQGVRLKRDLIMMAAADEERSGVFGAQWVVANHPELIRAEYALNEGGGNTSKVGDALLHERADRREGAGALQARPRVPRWATRASRARTTRWLHWPRRSQRLGARRCLRTWSPPCAPSSRRWPRSSRPRWHS